MCVCVCVVLSLQLNAIANRAAGKGYENEDNYSNIKFQFMGIENIHVMRNSQQKMLEGEIAALSSDDIPVHSSDAETKCLC